MERLFPAGAQDLVIEEVYRDLTFPTPPADRPYTLLNFVMTLDGQTTLGDTGAAHIGSKTDHRLMRQLRVVADAMLHGAGTVRFDNFAPRVAPEFAAFRVVRGLAAQPLPVVISASGNLDPSLRYFTAGPPVVFTTQARAAALAGVLGERATVVGMGEQGVDLKGAMALLRGRFGVKVLLCEGGARLTHGLIAAGLVDELFLTLAPKLGSDAAALRLVEGARFLPPDVPQLTLIQVLHHEGELFLRYRVPAAPVPLG